MVLRLITIIKLIKPLAEVYYASIFNRQDLSTKNNEGIVYECRKITLRSDMLVLPIDYEQVRC